MRPCRGRPGTIATTPPWNPLRSLRRNPSVVSLSWRHFSRFNTALRFDRQIIFVKPKHRSPAISARFFVQLLCQQVLDIEFPATTAVNRNCAFHGCTSLSGTFNLDGIDAQLGPRICAPGYWLALDEFIFLCDAATQKGKIAPLEAE